MTIKNDILVLLVKENLTSLEIANKLGIESDKIWIYLNTLFKEKKVERITEKKPYIYRAIIPLAYLRRLCVLMDEKMKYSKKPSKEDKELIRKIMELI